MSGPWHGLSDAECLALWDEFGWRQILQHTLVTAACCKEADVEDRLSALNTLNSAILCGVLPPDDTMSEFIIQILLDITIGDRGRWWKRWYLRPRMKSRVRGALNLMHTGAQFTQDVRDQVRAPVVGLPDVTVGAN